MRVQSPLLTRSLAALRLASNPGQPIVLAFTSDLELRESPELDAIRAELRGLGAALFLVAEGRAFAFRPDDELNPFGSGTELEPGALLALYNNCGLSPKTDPRELSVLIIAGTGELVTRQTVLAENGLQALADGLSRAGRAALSAQHSVLLSRREVVQASLVGAFALLAAESCRSRPPLQQAPEPPPAAKTAQTRAITLTVNGQPRELEIEPRVSLLDALRERLALTGSKKGCDHGQCGACTVLIAGRRVNACLTLAIMVGDAPVTTIEGLAQGDTLHPMQASFVAEDALQCGYCTPGQIVSAVGLVRENRAHTDAEVREHMSGNICRCGAYTNIVAAIQRARSAIPT